MTGWAAGERREGQVCREVYLSKEVVVQEKGASATQEEDGWTLGNARYVHGVWVKGLFGVCVSVCV